MNKSLTNAALVKLAIVPGRRPRAAEALAEAQASDEGGNCQLSM